MVASEAIRKRIATPGHSELCNMSMTGVDLLSTPSCGGSVRCVARLLSPGWAFHSMCSQRSVFWPRITLVHAKVKGTTPAGCKRSRADFGDALRDDEQDEARCFFFGANARIIL